MKYQETRTFSMDKLVDACIEHQLCTRMDCWEYGEMLGRADAIQDVRTEHLVEMAEWIQRGSEELDMEFTTLLYILNQATDTLFSEVAR